MCIQLSGQDLRESALPQPLEACLLHPMGDLHLAYVCMLPEQARSKPMKLYRNIPTSDMQAPEATAARPDEAAFCNPSVLGNPCKISGCVLCSVPLVYKSLNVINNKFAKHLPIWKGSPPNNPNQNWRTLDGRFPYIVQSTNQACSVNRYTMYSLQK